MHQALYRKWRPQTFDDVCGQDHITSVLRYEVGNNRPSHAYLFCGSRGTGKTTCAKLLAKAVNCENPVGGNPCGKCASCLAIDSGASTDVMEMDAASNTGVDYIRDIRDEVIYSPSAQKYRVYIIDEVHMLSISAFNALLKTLEEPPENVIFILATTELQKIPATVLSRCQRFDFRRIPSKVIASRLLFVAEQEGISLSEDAAFLIAKLAQGGMRDALSMLELCSGEDGGREITPSLVEETTGVIGRNGVSETVDALLRKDYAALFAIVNRLYLSSLDVGVFFGDLLAFYRDMLVAKTLPDYASYLDLTEVESGEVKRFASAFSVERLLSHAKMLEETALILQKPNAQKRVISELTLVRLCDDRLETSNDALLARLAALEEKVASGNVAPAAPVLTDLKQTKPEPPATEPVVTVPTPITSGEEKTGEEEKPFAEWKDTVKLFEKSDPATGAFLSRMGAKRVGKRIVILSPESFAITMTDRPHIREQLASVISGVTGERITGDRISFVCEGKTPENQSFFDEL